MPKLASSRSGRTSKPASSKPKAEKSPGAVHEGTKQALLIDLLKRQNGATIAEVAKALGWQPHSVRGAISGTFKKKLGLTVTSAPIEGRGRVYQIANAAARARGTSALARRTTPGSVVGMRKRAIMLNTVAEKIAELQNFSTPELRARWAASSRRPAPRHMSRDLLLRALVYRLQEQIEGGLSKAVLKRLAGLTTSNGSEVPPRQQSARRLRPDTRLVREWGGEVHQITVLDDGFEYRGVHHASLSKIARLITGTRWSGPLFFGLRKSRSQNSATST